jgi:hypothetical protein
MIFGNNRSLEFIAAKNLPGYDDFIDSSFIKDFNHEEELEIFYPPDHPSTGTKYTFDGSGQQTTIFGNFLSEKRRTEKKENELLSFRKDFFYPYQSEISFRVNAANIRPFPANDEGSSEFDGFLLEGSIVVGTQSGAKRFYAGPFKGYTKEIEQVCDDYTELNIKDKSDCDGWRKGSFYEPRYSPERHDVFNYVGSPRQRIDIVNPMNSSFMSDNPFGRLNYTWLNAPDRRNRPIPYNIENTDGNGTYAVAITKRHAVIWAETGDGQTNNLVFYSNSSGKVVPTIQTSMALPASAFKQMWDAIGFVNENSSSETYEVFEQMGKHFEGIRILTFASDLPNDIVPISLYDPNGSDFVFHSIVFGQERRGHTCSFCPPLKENEIGESTILFDSFNDCPLMPQFKSYNDYCKCLGKTNSTSNFSLPSTVAERVNSFGIDDGDIGSPLITYRNDIPVFLGFLSDYETVDGKNIGKGTILGLGSSKPYTFPWGVSVTPFQFLNMYLNLSGQSATNQKIFRLKVDTAETHPYPDGLYDGITDNTSFVSPIVLGDNVYPITAIVQGNYNQNQTLASRISTWIDQGKISPTVSVLGTEYIEQEQSNPTTPVSPAECGCVPFTISDCCCASLLLPPGFFSPDRIPYRPAPPFNPEWGPYDIPCGWYNAVYACSCTLSINTVTICNGDVVEETDEFVPLNEEFRQIQPTGWDTTKPFLVCPDENSPCYGVNPDGSEWDSRTPWYGRPTRSVVAVNTTRRTKTCQCRNRNTGCITYYTYDILCSQTIAVDFTPGCNESPLPDIIPIINEVSDRR